MLHFILDPKITYIYIQEYYIPKEAGLPIESSDEAQYYLIATHYDNPLLKEGIYIFIYYLFHFCWYSVAGGLKNLKFIDLRFIMIYI